MELLNVDFWSEIEAQDTDESILDTSISAETADALDAVDANIRAAEQQAGSMLLA